MDAVITKEDCMKIVNKVSNGKYQFVDFKIVPFAEETLGFLAEHSELKVIVNTSNKHNEALTFFMKTIPCDTENHKEYVTNIGVFKKEALLYKNLLPKLQSLSEVQFAPNSYSVNIDSHIVLENLILKGYSVVKDKSITLDFDHCKCAVESLARFHASSIIFEEKHSKNGKQFHIYDEYKHMLFETTFSYVEGHPRNDWLITTTETLVNVSKKIDKFKNIDTETVIRKLVKEMKQYIAPSKIYKNVINHADLWSNNIMFSYDENSLPKNCIIVDFQMARYVPPAMDFLTFIYLTTTLEFHEEHYMTLVDIYYSKFTSELKRHGINSDDIFTKNEFLNSLDCYKSASLLESAMFGTIVYLNPDFSKNMLSDPETFNNFMLKDRSTLVCKLFDEDEVYRKRVGSVVIQLLNSILK